MITQAAILVGGKGTRLGELTQFTPKPLLPIQKIPFLTYLILNLSSYGISDIILLTGHLGEQFETFAENMCLPGVTIRCIQEPAIAGTGGALVGASEFLNDVFLMLNGDSFFDINYALFSDSFNEMPSQLAKMALRTIKGSRYGRVKLSKDNQIENFYYNEDENDPNPINGGIYLLRKKILEYISSMPCSIEHEVFPLLAEKKLLQGQIFKDFFIDIGIPSDYEKAQTLLPELFEKKRP